ncbi:Lrp/AsnC family transcriptional regulator [Natronolimnobius sp. AArcel1]|uniref:Lrp/AsnC family transcriptional regulator n=1 Tax=Natronolimnobius sp. AArcel1 TaxID=1679093 RepID=UPI0013EA3D0A|nr:Lrp/AsnC family transcriptional regulator [Natronolimnobius sp. AArcel1]NGM68573.1 Lrp/AsnC family transcriptional regulator [Natronolimnobius sp. AArcel1]
MTKYELDAIDREILYALQAEARNLSSSEIAQRTDASSSTVRKRIQRLESEGIIKRYSAEIDYTMSGHPIRMLLFCTAPIPERGEYREQILDIPRVISVQELVTGEENLLVTAVGETDRDITPVAQELSDLGLTITDEVLVRSHETTTFDEFSSK